VSFLQSRQSVKERGKEGGGREKNRQKTLSTKKKGKREILAIFHVHRSARGVPWREATPKREGRKKKLRD